MISTSTLKIKNRKTAISTHNWQAKMEIIKILKFLEVVNLILEVFSTKKEI